MGTIMSMKGSTLLIGITDVEVLDHYLLRLTFSEGSVGDADVSYMQNYAGPYEGLDDPGYFKRVRVNPELRTIEWPNGLDPAPEKLYELAVPVHARQSLQRFILDVLVGHSTRTRAALRP